MTAVLDAVAANGVPFRFVLYAPGETWLTHETNRSAA